MSAERDPRRGQVRLPAFAESAAAEWQAPEAGAPALARQPGRARSAESACRIDVPAGALACVDPDRIRQAIDNLLGNSLRFAPAGSAIVIAAREDGPDLSIEVRDTGPGFPEDFLPHAFERFRRPDAGRSRDGGGSGLGLAIVQAIAVAHGGSIAAG